MAVISYQGLEEQFSRLMEDLDSTFTKAEWAEVSEFLDVSEYGIALETAAFIVAEEKRQSHPQHFKRFEIWRN
jgi:hypothetical protein